MILNYPKKHFIDISVTMNILKCLSSSLISFSDDKEKAKLFFELAAKCALEADNIEFAWKAAFNAGEI